MCISDPHIKEEVETPSKCLELHESIFILQLVYGYSRVEFKIPVSDSDIIVISAWILFKSWYILSCFEAKQFYSWLYSCKK